MNKSLQRSSLGLKDTEDDAHLTNKVRFAIGLASKSKLEKHNSKNAYSFAHKKSLSRKKAKGRLSSKKSKKSLNRQPNLEEIGQESITMEKKLWKASDEFREGIISWSNYLLIHNPKSKAKKFVCGSCKCAFLKIVEFTYHCFEICGEISHIESSHFIVHQNDLSNSLYEKLLSKEKIKQQELTHQKSRSKTTKKMNRKVNNLSSNVDQGEKYKNVINTQPKRQSKRFDSDEQTLEYKSENRKSKSITSAGDLSDQNQQDEFEIYSNFIQSQRKLKNPTRRPYATLKPKPFSKGEEAKFIKEKLQKIKYQSKQIIETIKSRYIQTKFIINTNYLPIFPSMVFVVNPLQNSVTSLNQFKRRCIKKVKLKNYVHSHFLERCCQINTPDSFYLILWADDFYQYLYEKAVDLRSIMLEGNEDIAYWKYLYQNTPMTQQIELKYPQFKYHLGYIHIFIHKKSIIKYCRSCKTTLPGDFIKDCDRISHKLNCKILSDKKVLLSVKNNDTVKQYSADIMNIEKIECYNFFCPCQSLENQMNILELQQHTKEVHKKHKIIDIGIFFNNK